MLRNCSYAAFVGLTFAALSVLAQPVWTQIMVTTSSSGDPSGDYYEFNGHPPSGHSTVYTDPDTDTASHSTLSLPISASTGYPDADGANDVSGTNLTDCGTSSGYPGYYTGPVPPWRPPQQSIKSNYGPSVGTYKGLSFYGAFNVAGIWDNCDFSSNCNLVQASYFHEQPCYAGGREYGVFYRFSDYTLAFYAATFANCLNDCSGNPNGPTVEWDVPSGSSWTDSDYFFELYPETLTGGGCGFHLDILGPPPTYTTEWSSSSSSNPVPSTITGSSVDPNFCSNILNEHGYTTTGIEYLPYMTNLDSNYSSTYVNMHIAAVKVGK